MKVTFRIDESGRIFLEQMPYFSAPNIRPSFSIELSQKELYDLHGQITDTIRQWCALMKKPFDDPECK